MVQADVDMARLPLAETRRAIFQARKLTDLDRRLFNPREH